MRQITKTQVDYNTLKALLIFAAKNDIRHYLNGIKIEGDKLIASDGHRMLIHKLNGPTSLNMVIPRDEIETALYLHQKSHRRNKNTSPISITKKTIGNVIFKEIDGRFPEWESVITDDYSQYEQCSDITVDGKYLADFGKVAKLLTGKQHLSIYGNKNNGPIIIKMNKADNSFGLLMPLIDKVESKMIPDWIIQSVTEYKTSKNAQPRKQA